MRRLTSKMWDDIFFWSLVIITAGILGLAFVSIQGCASAPSYSPRIGACLVDEAGAWFCKDADGVSYVPIVNSPTTPRYVCLKLEDEWKPLINYCKKDPK